MPISPCFLCTSKNSGSLLFPALCQVIWGKFSCVLYYPSQDWQLLKLSVCIFMFQTSNGIDDFLLYSFQSTGVFFFEVVKPIQNTLGTSLWEWESISLREYREISTSLTYCWQQSWYFTRGNVFTALCADGDNGSRHRHMDDNRVFSFVCYKAGFVTFQKQHVL